MARIANRWRGITLCRAEPSSRTGDHRRLIDITRIAGLYESLEVGPGKNREIYTEHGTGWCCTDFSPVDLLLQCETSHVPSPSLTARVVVSSLSVSLLCACRGWHCSASRHDTLLHSRLDLIPSLTDCRTRTIVAAGLHQVNGYCREISNLMLLNFFICRIRPICV